MNRLFIIPLIFFFGCSEQDRILRHYTETIQPPPHVNTGSGPATPAPAALTWEAPGGWKEQPGSGMRLVTFLVGPDDAECWITGFPGNAGGREANLRRWAGQLNLEPGEQAFQQFAQSPESFVCQGGQPGSVFNFNKLEGIGETSMLAGIVTRGNQTLFVKLMGAVSLMDEEYDRFLGLCRSLK